MYLLHLTHIPSGVEQTIPCTSAFLRALWIISLSSQSVIVRCEDRGVSA